MTTFFIYPNAQKPKAWELLPQVCRLLDRPGVRLLLPEHAAALCADLHAGFLPEEEAVRLADLAIVLGGDGTMLRLARAAAQQHLPMLGINVGHIGFITELEPDELEQMEKLLTGRYTLDSRMMLHVTVIRHGRRVYENDALNDIVLGKGASFRLVRARIAADDAEVTRINGDGVIICTPTGSTAYGLSAGGPVIEPSAENLAVIPVCAHALAAKSFVFAPERRILLSASCEGGGNPFISADGGEGFAVRAHDRIEVTRSALRTQLVRLKGQSFYTILQQKL